MSRRVRPPLARVALAAVGVRAALGAVHLSRPTGLASEAAGIGLRGLAVRAGRPRPAPPE